MSYPMAVAIDNNPYRAPELATRLRPIWTQDTLRRILMQDRKAVEWAIVQLDRRDVGPHVRDGRGWNRADRKYGAYLTAWIVQGKTLSGSHLARAEKLAIKYIRQLTESANLRTPSFYK